MFFAGRRGAWGRIFIYIQTSSAARHPLVRQRVQSVLQLWPVYFGSYCSTVPSSHQGNRQLLCNRISRH